MNSYVASNLRLGVHLCCATCLNCPPLVKYHLLGPADVRTVVFLQTMTLHDVLQGPDCPWGLFKDRRLKLRGRGLWRKHAECIRLHHKEVADWYKFCEFEWLSWKYMGSWKCFRGTYWHYLPSSVSFMPEKILPARSRRTWRADFASLEELLHGLFWKR